MRVEVYRNLHKNCWSVKDSKTGRVTAHLPSLVVEDATFVVRPAGRAKVLREQRKNVHAFVKGTLGSTKEEEATGERVSYNPYRFGFFFNAKTEEPVTAATVVHLAGDGKVYIS
jgi:hypothetical protein